MRKEVAVKRLIGILSSMCIILLVACGTVEVESDEIPGGNRLTNPYEWQEDVGSAEEVVGFEVDTWR